MAHPGGNKEMLIKQAFWLTEALRDTLCCKTCSFNQNSVVKKVITGDMITFNI